MKSNYILLKDLPNYPAGRIFRPTADGTEYFSSVNDREFLKGEVQTYKLKASVVENNTEWFKVEELSDLQTQLQEAFDQKESAEQKISELTQRIKEESLKIQAEGRANRNGQVTPVKLIDLSKEPL